jgi:dGTPase
VPGRPSVDGYGAADLARFGGSEDEDPRSPFARDYDRLIYTAEFRRLQGKTQVVTAGEADFFRTRLTHTIEVAQVARRIAEAMNRRAMQHRRASGTPSYETVAAAVAALPPGEQLIDPDLCETAAILHDLGHAPYGHAGEAALLVAVNEAAKAWGLSTVGGFEGNAQSFRLVTAVLSHHGTTRGLQLTHATLDACLKYPWTSGTPTVPEPNKWSVYPTEQAALDAVRVRVPEALRHEPSIEAQVMDWADDVAYSVHDLEDWYRAGYVPLPRLAIVSAEQDRFVEWVVERWRGSGDPRAEDVDQLASRIRDEVIGPEFTPLSGFRVSDAAGERIHDPDSGAGRRAIRRLRGAVFDDAMSDVDIYPRGPAVPTGPRRYAFGFRPRESVRFTVDVLKELLWFYVVPDARIATMQHGQQALLTRVFKHHVRAVETAEFRIFPAERAALLRDRNDGRERLRLVADYISGLTDAGALRLDARLRSGGERLHDYI